MGLRNRGRLAMFVQVDGIRSFCDRVRKNQNSEEERHYESQQVQQRSSLFTRHRRQVLTSIHITAHSECAHIVHHCVSFIGVMNVCSKNSWSFPTRQLRRK